MFDIKGILDPLVAVINKVIPDKTAAAAATAELNQMASAGQLQDELLQLQAVTSAQTDIDKVEASSASTFVAGWRPLIGWVGGVALAFQYIGRPLVMIAFSLAHQPAPVLPGIDEGLWQLMGCLLGLGGYRTYEKLKGVVGVH